MSRGVTYNGVESATGGNIFKDMVFWVAQRVPTRSVILNHIKNNGGKVVPLEKDAHILIADHARKDAHPDAHSWTYITESVQHGYAQLTDRYRIFGYPETAGVHAGASAPVRRIRTPFSAADDAALANWVLAHTQGRSGNKIFQEFAETHSWHTWQSWRNRFVKSLGNLPIADLEKLAMSAADLAVQTARSTNQPTSYQAGPKQQKEQLRKAAEAPRKTPEKREAVRASQLPAAASPSSSPDNVQITIASTARSEQRYDDAPVSPTKSEKSEVGTQDAMRGGFYTDLLAFVKETGADLDPEPCIGGAKVDLWDLGQAVAVQRVSVEEVDWMKVAEHLKYNWAENKGVAAELQRCYKNNLADFFEEVSGFSLKYDGEFKDEQLSGPLSPESDVPSSPPRQSSRRKRSADNHILPAVGSSSKRRRLSRNAEIPSTPEEIVGVPTTQSPSVTKAKQLQQADAGTTKTSLSPALPRAIDDYDDEIDEGHVNGAETQFRRVPGLDAQQSTFDVTPSQQLHSEALDVTPIPLNLRGRDVVNAQPARRNSESVTEPEASMPKRKATDRLPRRSWPASFQPAPGRFSPQQAEARARRPSAPTRADLDEEGNSQDIRDCMEYYESLGYSRPIVVESLMRTTITPGWPTSLLLERLYKKEGVPSNCEGIWTDRDDKSLRYADAVEARKSSASTRELNKAKKELDRIVHKHTQEAVDLRRRFLRTQAIMGRN